MGIEVARLMPERERDLIPKRSVPRVPMRRVAQYFRNVVQMRLAGRSSDDDLASMLDLSRRNDPSSNVETTPPEDEQVDLHCMWAVEFYAPSHVDKLVDNLKKLGWDQNDF